MLHSCMSVQFEMLDAWSIISGGKLAEEVRFSFSIRMLLKILGKVTKTGVGFYLTEVLVFWLCRNNLLNLPVADVCFCFSFVKVLGLFVCCFYCVWRKSFHKLSCFSSLVLNCIK